MAEILKPYQDLADQLRAGLAQIETLQTEREGLQAEKERLGKAGKEIGNAIYEARGKNGLAPLVGKLESAEREQKVTIAQLEALGGHLAAHEAELHKLLPKACFTFQRLCGALKTRVLDLERGRIELIVAEHLRSALVREIELLAESSCAVMALHDLQTPSGGNWSIIRPLEEKSREETMRVVCETTHKLLEAAQETFTELGKLADQGAAAEIPAFFLGEPEPEPKPEQQPQGLEPVEVSSLDSFRQEEREFVLQICREAGKSLETLSGDERLALANTLENWRDRFRGRHPVMAVGRQADY
jgi:hypothetical protein